MMLKKPNECCKQGSSECQVPMVLSGKVQGVDYCISHIVAALNAGNVKTLTSCCGHKTRPGNIVLDDGIVLTTEDLRDWSTHQKPVRAPSLSEKPSPGGAVKNTDLHGCVFHFVGKFKIPIDQATREVIEKRGGSISKITNTKVTHIVVRDEGEWLKFTKQGTRFIWCDYVLYEQEFYAFLQTLTGAFLKVREPSKLDCI